MFLVPFLKLLGIFICQILCEYAGVENIDLFLQFSCSLLEVDYDSLRSLALHRRQKTLELKIVAAVL